MSARFLCHIRLQFAASSLHALRPRLCVDAEAAGARKPFVTLPYWLLWFLVRVAVLLSIVCHTIFCGLQILHPKTGAFHDKCLFELCVGALPLATIRVPRTNGRPRHINRRPMLLG